MPVWVFRVTCEQELHCAVQVVDSVLHLLLCLLVESLNLGIGSLRVWLAHDKESRLFQTLLAVGPAKELLRRIAAGAVAREDPGRALLGEIYLDGRFGDLVRVVV